MTGHNKLIDILLVEDNPADARLTVEAMKHNRILNRIHIVRDGMEALDFLHKRGNFADAPLPDLILLDLNMPRKNGHEVLAEIKKDLILRRIPVVVLTTSDAEVDIKESYRLHANCYVTKPFGFDQFITVCQSIENFWLTVVKLPPVEDRCAC